MSPLKEATRTDILEVLARDHDDLEVLLNRFESVELDHKAAWFDQVRENLVRHEVGEEIAVYPHLRRISAAGDRIVGARIEEQAEEEVLLAHLEDIDVRGDAFRKVFADFRKAVLDHTHAEEAVAFPFIRQEKPLHQRGEMARHFETARKLAPTHPHPHAPHNPPGNLIVSPIAALADRIRDVFHAVDL
jgi:hemerythrin superfamily protein